MKISKNKAQDKNQGYLTKYRWIRIMVQVLFILLFLSQAFGLKFYQGNLIAGSLLGIEFSDPLATLDFFIASKTIYLPLLFSALIVIIFFTLMGARTFCGWVCPIYLLTELNEKAGNLLSNFLYKKEIKAKSRRKKFFDSKNITFDHNLKYKILLSFLFLSLVTGLPVFEIISPIGTLGRIFVFGFGISALIIVILIVFEIIFSQRGWCHYLCPVGAIYSLLGKISPYKIHLNLETCTKCTKCQKVCIVPEILEAPIQMVNPLKKKKISREVPWKSVHSGECTYCLNCIDICPERAILLKIK